MQAAEAYAREALFKDGHPDLQFHTIIHTEQVVKAVQEIAGASGLSEEDTEIITLAAWFHDLGYTKVYVGHEQESKKMADAFFSEMGVAREKIEKILALIEATRLDVEPSNIDEQVIKDADLYNLATDEALDYTRKLRVEWKTFCDREFKDRDWYNLNLDFFRNHVYYTDYGKQNLVPKKLENIALLEKKIKQTKQAKKLKKLKSKAINDLEKELGRRDKQIDKLNSKVEKLKVQRPDRGIETMFRTTYRTHISLSAIADNKANILLSINAIIISIVSSSLIGSNEYEDYPWKILPFIVLLMSCMATIVYAILATRPKVNSGVFTKEDILQKRTNLLFFGNFHSMPLNEYQWGIGEMMKDSQYLYGSMATDIYFLGVVLAKKFKLLRTSYTIFMYGIGISLIAFILIFWLGPKEL